MFSFLNNSKAENKSFYDLSINSIDGNEIKFSNFKVGPHVHNILSQHYDGSEFIIVNPLDTTQGLVEISPEKHNHSNMLEINVFSNKAQTQCLLTATFDNLGKGASRAAIQSISLMLDL